MKLKYDFAVREIAGTWAAITIGESSKLYHNVIALNETGADIFRLIQEGCSEDEIIRRMLDQYEVTEEVLRPEVDKLIQNLKDEHLLED